MSASCRGVLQVKERARRGTAVGKKEFREIVQQVGRAAALRNRVRLACKVASAGRAAASRPPSPQRPLHPGWASQPSCKHCRPCLCAAQLPPAWHAPQGWSPLGGDISARTSLQRGAPPTPSRPPIPHPNPPQAVRGKPMSREEVDLLYRVFDTNKDGFLELSGAAPRDRRLASMGAPGAAAAGGQSGRCARGCLAARQGSPVAVVLWSCTVLTWNAALLGARRQAPGRAPLAPGRAPAAAPSTPPSHPCVSLLCVQKW